MFLTLAAVLMMMSEERLIPPEFDRYHVVMMVRGEKADQFSGQELDRLQNEHLAYLKKLYLDGHLMAMGPFEVGQDDPSRGMKLLRGDLTAENYEFGEETSGPGVTYVLLKPKRKDVMLVDGRMVLSRDGDLLRVEGLLSKNPSFWTTQVYVTRHYARVDGVRVPIATESLAKIRFVGRSRLDVKYEYESVNGQPVTTAAARALATGAAAAGR